MFISCLLKNRIWFNLRGYTNWIGYFFTSRYLDFLDNFSLSPGFYVSLLWIFWLAGFKPGTLAANPNSANAILYKKCSNAVNRLFLTFWFSWILTDIAHAYIQWVRKRLRGGEISFGQRKFGEFKELKPYWFFLNRFIPCKLSTFLNNFC